MATSGSCASQEHLFLLTVAGDGDGSGGGGGGGGGLSYSFEKREKTSNLIEYFSGSGWVRSGKGCPRASPAVTPLFLYPVTSRLENAGVFRSCLLCTARATRLKRRIYNERSINLPTVGSFHIHHDHQSRRTYGGCVKRGGG